MLRMYSCSESEGWSSEEDEASDAPILIVVEDSDEEQDTQTRKSLPNNVMDDDALLDFMGADDKRPAEGEAVSQRCLCIPRQASPTPERVSQSGRGDTSCETADPPEEETELDMELDDNDTTMNTRSPEDDVDEKITEEDANADADAEQ